ncbi:MAG: hypothetical protein ACOY0T_33600 [Myxococcota bacterium]
MTGPDHVLSLGPAALSHPRRSFSIGLRWGLGHSLGTLVLALPLLFATRVVELELLARLGDRLSAIALLAMGAWSYRALRNGQHAQRASDTRDPLIIGLVHGVGGAASLMLVLPVLVSGSLAKTLLFLFAFAFGSTLAMAALTSALARLGNKLAAATLPRTQRALAAISIALGAIWFFL